jgi:heat shock protein HslJ
MKYILTLNSSVILVVIFVVLGSCKAQKQNKMNAEKLMAQDYIITQLGDEEISKSKLSLKVNPENSTLSGFSGCNSFSFNYELKNGKLDLGFASATKIFCEEGMDLENLFFQKAASVTQFENSAEALHLKNKSGDIVIKAKTKAQRE